MHNGFDKKKYDQQYVQEKYYRVHILLAKRYKEPLTIKAKESGSLRAYIQKLIDRDLEEHPINYEQQINIDHEKE